MARPAVIRAEAPPIFRGATIDLDELEAWINTAADDSYGEFDWQWLDPEPIKGTPRVYVFGWLLEYADESPPPLPGTSCAS